MVTRDATHTRTRSHRHNPPDDSDTDRHNRKSAHMQKFKSVHAPTKETAKPRKSADSQKLNTVRAPTHVPGNTLADKHAPSEPKPTIQ